MRCNLDINLHKFGDFKSKNKKYWNHIIISMCPLIIVHLALCYEWYFCLELHYLLIGENVIIPLKLELEGFYLLKSLGLFNAWERTGGKASWEGNLICFGFRTSVRRCSSSWIDWILFKSLHWICYKLRSCLLILSDYLCYIWWSCLGVLPGGIYLRVWIDFSSFKFPILLSKIIKESWILLIYYSKLQYILLSSNMLNWFFRTCSVLDLADFSIQFLFLSA